jgi:hypothetical protein
MVPPSANSRPMPRAVRLARIAANGAADGGSAPVPAFGRAVALLAGTGARP